MLTLAGIIAIAGVLTDSTATVIGAMIIAPLGTPILGIALGMVTGHLSLVLRSIMWVLAGLAIVVVLGLLFSVVRGHTAEPRDNSQVVGRTSPSLMDLIAALATGFAGGFAMCRKDLSAVLPGVAIAISLVPPLGVVGVCAGQGQWSDALRGARALPLERRRAGHRGQHRLHDGRLRAGTRIVADRQPASRLHGRQRARRRHRTAARRQLDRSRSRSPAGRVTIQETAVTWLTGENGARVYDVQWSGMTATLDVTTDDGSVPPIEDSAAVARRPRSRASSASCSMSVRASSTSSSERMPRLSRRERRRNSAIVASGLSRCGECPAPATTDIAIDRVRGTHRLGELPRRRSSTPRGRTRSRGSAPSARPRRPARPTRRSARSSARPPTGSPGAPTAPSARCPARATAGGSARTASSVGSAKDSSWLARTISRSRSVELDRRIDEHEPTRPRRDRAAAATVAAAPPSECAMTRSHAPPASGRGRGEVGGVRADRVVERARRRPVSAQVDRVRSPARRPPGRRRSATSAAPFEPRPWTSSARRAASGIAPRQAGEGERCRRGCRLATAYERPEAPRAGP